MKIQKFVAALHKVPHKNSISTHSDAFSFVYTSNDECFHLAFSLRNRCKTVPQPRVTTRQRLIIGDDAECRDSSIETCMANAVAIEFDAAQGYLSLTSSIVGLPPIFIYQDSEKIVVASDVFLLLSVNDVDLHFNPDSIMEMSRIGHPINGKTLFNEVKMLPTGSSFTWSRGHAVIKRLWNYTDYVRRHATLLNLESLACFFKRALASIDISRSYLSLTGGLDTRTILALLVANGTYIPAYTITGHRPNVDAKISSNLCKAYGISHELVVLDNAFLKNLSYHVMEASRLSGGLCSLDEAHEVYFYSVISKDLESRLSGNLGNQLGRLGTERISMRNASHSVLHKSLTTPRKQQDADWHSGFSMGKDDASHLGFLLEEELRATSVANYSIGSNYAVQQTPYANRVFIEGVLGASSNND